MTLGRVDPGECLVCGAAHCACTDSGPVIVSALPQRDASAAAAQALVPSLADQVQATLPPGAFTTGTYRRLKKSP